MNIRFENLQRKAASAAAALALSTLFIGAAVGPALTQTGSPASVQASAPVA
jgi:hypothetical protein